MNVTAALCSVESLTRVPSRRDHPGAAPPVGQLSVSEIVYQVSSRIDIQGGSLGDLRTVCADLSNGAHYPPRVG